VKKAALSQLLLEKIVGTQAHDDLDEKLASIALPDTVGECGSLCKLFLGASAQVSC